jgi:hypothetical protein
MVESLNDQLPNRVKEIVHEFEREKIFTFDGKYKAQIDCYHQDMILDWKTCAQISRCCIDGMKYGHLIQAYHYAMCVHQTKDIDTLMQIPFVFAYVSISAPYEALFFEVTEEQMRYGQKQWEHAIIKMQSSEVDKKYPNANNNEILPYVGKVYLDDDDIILEEF